MARPLRIAVADGVYHVTARGNAKQSIYSDELDRRRFLSTLGRALSRYGWHCLAYCLMENHYHLLVETPRPNLPAGMRELNGVYAQQFNRRHDRCGHLFQARYSAVLVQRDAHLLETARYIALNPVRAGLCEQADDWPWSSHRTVIGAAADDFVAVHRLLSHFGEDGLARYRAFVDDLTESPRKAGGDVIVGTPAFRAAHLPAAPPSREVVSRSWEELRPPLEELFAGMERDDAIVTAFREFGYRMTEIAELLGCHYATVSRRIKAWEARREMLDCKT